MEKTEPIVHALVRTPNRPAGRFIDHTLLLTPKLLQGAECDRQTDRQRGRRQ